MITYLFPGQGSEQKGMGESLFNDFPETTNKADSILGYSIKKLCLENPENKLNQTQYTQPALYVVNALAYVKKKEEGGKSPDFLAGHSLGEYSALFASGAFDFETGLKLVQHRGALMAQAKGGGMAAVIGLSSEKIEKILMENALESIDIANYNSPSQTIISGPLEQIKKARSAFEKNGTKFFIPIRVSGPFHSRYMDSSRKEFKKFIGKIKFSELSIPVISNVHARPYMKKDIAINLINQITNPVRWLESIRYLKKQANMQFEEIGHGSVLKRLLKNIEEESPLERVNKYANNNRRNNHSFFIKPASLGSLEYKKDYGVDYAYAAGGMFRGISSKDLVVKMGKAGFIGYFGTGGLSLSRIEEAVISIQKELTGGQPYGFNLLHHPDSPQVEENILSLLQKYRVRNIEASAFMRITPALVKFRANGLSRKPDGTISIKNKIMAKLSRPEVAQAFLSPAPEKIINNLMMEKKITEKEAELLKNVLMADDLCVEADSGGHTDQGTISALIPAIVRLRDEMMEKYKYSNKVRIGAAGGIGTPEAAASAFILGAEFILTGSINQCTVEAGTSDSVKELLEGMNVQDTEYAPAGDMFEIGAKVQVLKKGLFFPSRANKLYELYRRYNSLDEIDEKTKKQLQEKFFRRSFDEIYDDVKIFFSEVNPGRLEKAERNPKYKMALIFRWYFDYSTNIALAGNEERKVDYQVHCGPALGAFNQWVKGTELEHWENRHVDQIAQKMMTETAELLNRRFDLLTQT